MYTRIPRVCTSGPRVHAHVSAPRVRRQLHSTNKIKIKNVQKQKHTIVKCIKLKSKPTHSKAQIKLVRQIPRANAFIPKKQLIANSVTASVAKQYLAYADEFINWLNSPSHGNKYPSFNQLLINCNIVVLDDLLGDFATYKFNNKHVTGGTLKNAICGILYKLSLHDIYLTAEMLPSIRRICKGVDNILMDHWNIPVNKGKNALLNPILEALMNKGKKAEAFLLLFQTRFCLRSQHTCYNPKLNHQIYIRRGNVHFEPSNSLNPVAMTIINTRDKNNRTMNYMDRTLYCTCHTIWSCVVCLGYQYYNKYNYLPSTAGFLRKLDGTALTYNYFQDLIKLLAQKLGLNPADYGTHSCRAGGTSELFLAGKTAVFIQNFVRWKNIGSTHTYIRPSNPDLRKFVTSVSEYCRLRKLESVNINHTFDDLSASVINSQKQDVKRYKGNKLNSFYKKLIYNNGINLRTLNLPNLIDNQFQIDNINSNSNNVNSNNSNNTTNAITITNNSNSIDEQKLTNNELTDKPVDLPPVPLVRAVAPIPIVPIASNVVSSIRDKKEIDDDDIDLV